MDTQIMPNWLMKRADLTPDRIAFRFKRDEWTFKDLNEAAIHTAKKLGSLGIKKGDHVALLLQNSPQMVKLIHGLAYLGAVSVLLNTRLTAHELSWQIEDANAVVLIYDKENAIRAEEITVYTGKAICPLYAWEELFALTESKITLQTEYNLDDHHSLIYTSGTTGYPKGVLLTYGNHWWSAIGSSLNLGLHHNDCWLASLPFFHVSGLSILMRSVIYGISVLVQDTFNPQQANQAIREGRVTIMSVVSTMLAQMVDHLQEENYPSTFRCMLVGGGPVPLHLLEECTRRQIPVYQTYGMTETASQIVTLGPEYMLSKLGSAGKPLFPAELRIVRDGIHLQAREVGEIVVKGANVTKGYYLREEATAQAMKNGWFYTGDLGYLDEDGFLFVVDRRSDLIISGGENVYPAEIEAVLTSHPAVEEAGVVGTYHDQWGEVPVAFVKLREGYIDTDELASYCRTKLASYKVPHRIHVIDEIPRNASNKILRRELKELLITTEL